MMGKCRRVEGASNSACGTEATSGCGAISKTTSSSSLAKQYCSNYWTWGFFNNHKCDGEPEQNHNPVTGNYYWSCSEGDTKCSKP